MSEEEQLSGEQIVEAAAPAQADVEETLNEQSTNDPNQMVPLSALQSERDQRQGMQEELRMMKDHLALVESNQNRPPTPPVKDEFEGIEDDDILTFGDAKKLLGKVQKNYQGSVEELKMTQKHPDYQEVIQNYLPDVLNENPSLRRSLEQTQDYELAYHLAKNSDSYKDKNKKTKKSLDAKRIIENSAEAGSLSSLGSTSPISHAKRYKDMGDEDFRKLVNRNLGII